MIVRIAQKRSLPQLRSILPQQVWQLGNRPGRREAAGGHKKIYFKVQRTFNGSISSAPTSNEY